MAGQRPKPFADQKTRKAYFLGRQRQRATGQNSDPYVLFTEKCRSLGLTYGLTYGFSYMYQQWHSFVPHPTSQAWTPPQANPLPTMNVQQPYMSPGQLFDAINYDTQVLLRLHESRAQYDTQLLHQLQEYGAQRLHIMQATSCQPMNQMWSAAPPPPAQQQPSAQQYPSAPPPPAQHQPTAPQ